MVLSIAGETGAVFTHPHNTPNFYTSFCFCTWYFIANKVPGFGTNTSCIKGLKSTYKAKEGSKGCRIRAMTKYQEADREAEMRLAEQGQLQGRSPEQELLRNNPLEDSTSYAEAPPGFCFQR